MNDLTLSVPTASANLQPEPVADYAPRQLLTPLPTPGHFLLVIDNSSLEVFTTCPQSAYYKLVLKREAHARNAALTFGGALHEGLELFLQRQYWYQGDIMQAPAGFENQCGREAQDQQMLKFFTENPSPLDEYRTVQNALAVLAAYRERASLPDYQWEIQSDSSGPIIERAFELPLGVVTVEDELNCLPSDGPRWSDSDTEDGDIRLRQSNYVKVVHIAWSGRIDAIARCGNPNVIRVVDHKTTSIMGDSFMQDFQISNQVLGYVWAARQLWPDLDVSAFCLNAIHFKKPAGTQSISNLIQHGTLTAPGPRGGQAPLSFVRGYYEYSPLRLTEWADNCLNIVSDFIHCLVRDSFPRHTKWCFGKYGKCQYHDVCVQDDPAVRHNMIHSDMFKTVTWNPVAGR